MSFVQTVLENAPLTSLVIHRKSIEKDLGHAQKLVWNQLSGKDKGGFAFQQKSNKTLGEPPGVTKFYQCIPYDNTGSGYSSNSFKPTDKMSIYAWHNSNVFDSGGKDFLLQGKDDTDGGINSPLSRDLVSINSDYGEYEGSKTWCSLANNIKEARTELKKLVKEKANCFIGRKLQKQYFDTSIIIDSDGVELKEISNNFNGVKYNNIDYICKYTSTKQPL